MATLDTAGFIHNLFTVTLTTGPNNPNGDFHSYADIIGYNTQNDDPGVNGQNGVGSPGNPAHPPEMAAILSDIGDQWNALPVYFTKGKCRDTSIGGNDAINCYPQFNETDDVAEHPFLSTDPNDPLSGMGRVYSEVYDDQQQVLYLTFGVPQFNDLSAFYSGAIVENLAKLMNDGVNAGDLGRLIGQTIGSFVSLPALPLVFIYRVLNLAGFGSAKITKYYDFKSTMPLYYRAVNSIILHISINLGLYKDTVLVENDSSLNAGGVVSNTSMQEQYAESIQSGDGNSLSGLPDIFKKFGPDIYMIMLKKYKYATGNYPSGAMDSDAALLGTKESDPVVDMSAAGKSFMGDFFSQFTGQLYDASLYVGFRIEKGVDTSESFTNETGESAIAQQVNSKAQQARDARFTSANGNIDGGIASAFMGAVGGVLSGIADATMGSSVENILAGAGVVDFPEVWKSSSFSKNYHFNISLRSPYGDPISILQNLYIPLALLLGGGMPRAIGPAAYTAPFVCRAYCKGMFAVPLGMIGNMTIKRGADQFGWSTQRLPTCIDVSFEIKDLSPAMYLAIGDGGAWEALKEVFGANSNFQEYLMTLSGMGLLDRLSWIRNLRRKATYLLGQVSSKFSPYYIGAVLGTMVPARVISTFIPTTRSLLSNR